MSDATKERVAAIVERLNQEYPDARCALEFSNPLELLIATILSAQCTDERVNIVTRNLFQKYKSAADYANVNPAELEEDIRSTGFYKNKAKNVINCCKMLVEKYGGEVPATMEELVVLPGTGRKTANVVLGNAFNVPGIAVDTHVTRLSQRLGLSTNDDPVKIEQDLMAILPPEVWTKFSHLIITHGRKVCTAKKVFCERCVINDLCPWPGKTTTL